MKLCRFLADRPSVDRDGNPIVSEKGGILESVDGSLNQPLYGPNLSTDFSLKVLQTSQGNMFRLLFTVSYFVEAIGNCEEKIYSRPFVVHSNRRKNSKGTTGSSPAFLTHDREADCRRDEAIEWSLFRRHRGLDQGDRIQRER